MKAVIALLSDGPTQNLVRRMALDLCEHDKAPLNASLLPANISLKQGFRVASLTELEAFLDGFAASIPPFGVVLGGLYYNEWDGNGIVGLQVIETPLLRSLHERLNSELSARFGDVSAAHDGQDYRFHMTVEMGELNSENPYRWLYERWNARGVQAHFTVRELALFLDPCETDSGPFMVYKTVPLGLPLPA